MRRILRQASVTAALVLATAGLAPSAEAAIQIGSFESATGDYTYNNGALTGTTGGNYTFDPAFAALFGLPGSTFTNASLTVSANATGNATSGGGQVSQTMAGFISVTDLDSGDLLVRADFTGAVLSGFIGTTSVTLFGSTVIGTVAYTSDVFDITQIVPPHELRFALTPTSAPVSLSGNNFANFTAPDIANFSTTVEAAEPASLALFGLALGALGSVVRKRRK